MTAGRWIALATLICAACSDPSELTVDLRSDYSPRTDFSEVRTELSPVPFGEASPSQVRRVTTEPAPSTDFLFGERVAEYDHLSLGQKHVRVSLLDGAGETVASREVDLELTESYALTVVITRNCRDRVCPAAGDEPAHTACLDGRCVDPRCSASTPEHCGAPSCETSVDCEGRAGCPGDARCYDGVCLCGEVPPDAGADAGPEIDAGPGCPPTETACGDGEDDDCDGATDCADPDCADVECDDGDACTSGDVCWSGACTGSPVSCDDDNPCTDDSCDPATGCSSTPNTSSCNDGNACTSGDVCSGGTCGGSAISCDDGNPCTTDSCDPSSGCVNTPRAEHSTCGATHLRCCGGSCVDTRSSNAHCGGCGMACASGHSCEIYDSIPTCTCTANTQCRYPDGVCSPTYDYHCACRNDAGCASGLVCADRVGRINYCHY